MTAAEIGLVKGRYRVRQAAGAADVAAAQALRSRCFGTSEPDRDAYDACCTHVLVEEIRSGALVCCFRLLLLESGAELARSYAAQFYGLAGLQGFAGRMAELGRFCIDPGAADPDILRIAWGALAAFVDANSVQMLFGCSSFAGTDPRPYGDCFALLRQRHLGPVRWQPEVKAPEVVRFAAGPAQRPDARRAMQELPPLLRTYLVMGAGSAAMRWWTGS